MVRRNTKNFFENSQIVKSDFEAAFFASFCGLFEVASHASSLLAVGAKFHSEPLVKSLCLKLCCLQHGYGIVSQVGVLPTGG